MTNALGIVVSIGYVGLVLGLSLLLQKKARWGQDATRKFVHIGVSGWWIIAMLFFSSALFACIVPAAFIVVNALSHRHNLISSMERSGANDTLGTVYYAISLTLLALFSFGVGKPYIGALGVYCMGLGDGFAAVVGKRIKGRVFSAPGGKKSLWGSAAMFLFSFAACLVILLLFAPQNAVWVALLLATLATALEFVSPNGLDNLTVPLEVSFTYTVLFAPVAGLQGLLAGILLSSAIILLAWQKKLLTAPACVCAIAVGALFYALGGWPLWVLLIWFFASSNIITRLRERGGKSTVKKGHSGPRKTRQVLANSVPALFCAGLFRLWGNPWLLAAGIGAVAAATADTWASEIGIMSRRQPVSILTLKPVQRGLSGGVSLLGLAASAGGAVSVAVLAAVLYRLEGSLLQIGLQMMVLVVLCGMAGSLADSVLGVLLQAKYYSPVTGLYTEHKPTPAHTATLVSGVHWMNNDAVNFFSGALVVALALMIVL